MLRLLLIIQWICLFLFSNRIIAQKDITPSAFLGIDLGDNFTYHYQLVDYFELLSNKYPSKAKYISYGATSEGRELFVFAITSSENMTKLEEIKKDNLYRIGIEEGKVANKIPVIWLGYNVHGNEASGSEVAMKVAHKLLSSDEKEINKVLDNAVVVIDPCMNPDGRDRYVNGYRARRGEKVNSNALNWSHVESWPSGRYNHYLFDLNRDWAWQTQLETKLRYALYKEWMPQVYVDFHEMMPEYSYFFGPPAHPIHEEITTWQRKYQRISSQRYIDFFEEHNWKYFTEEIFDLLYPSYGDSWTSFNGAVGFTFEQGGHGVAGVSYKKKPTDRALTLKQRIEKHYETTLLTLFTAVDYKEQLLKEYQAFFKSKPKGQYSQFIIRNNSRDHGDIKRLLKLMDTHRIKYSMVAKGKSVTAYSYQLEKNIEIYIKEHDILFDINQPFNKTLEVLLEPKTEITDSLTYDLTAWSLPYAYGLEAYAIESNPKFEIKQFQEAVTQKDQVHSIEKDYIYIVPWNSIEDTKVLTRFLDKKIDISYLNKGKNIFNTFLPKGSIVINPETNESNRKLNFINKVLKDVNYIKAPINKLGLISDCLTPFKEKRISVLAGGESNPLDFGALWHFFDHELNYPIQILDVEKLSTSKLFNTDVLLVGDGRYSPSTHKVIENFVKVGGRVILFEGATKIMSENTTTDMYDSLHISLVQKSRSSEASSKTSLNKRAAGCIVKVELDTTTNISNGLNPIYYSLKQSKLVLPKIGLGENLGTFPESPLVSGYLGQGLKLEMPGKSLIAIEKYKKGEIFYFGESPLFRGFWVNGMLLLSNAIFFDY
ncbi:M14 family zinc carboxypeptidase [Flammeovirga sp. SubArs3]|uniref:M14 family zinc carboxypeptidase n=1 Tax=Flammeovirga sp. SubArs3 TaxID=2995316 RepID=UPI00248CAC99|nr:M14 family zinc carboxypeptidase [Flammeovirga sp. SubArs3]